VLSPVPVAGGQIDGMVVFEEPFFLREGLVFVVEYLITQAVLDHP
jgi:hypothetical protein